MVFLKMDGISNIWNFKHILFTCMLVTYGIFISFLYDKIQISPSISKIIGENREPILIIMVIMGVFTILYEIHQYRKFSIFSSIIGLLIGIYGIILLDEENLAHYFFAGIIASSIFIFMFSHCLIWTNDIYWLLFYLTILAFIGCLVDMDTNITYWEAGFIGLFAIYYISLHIFYL